MTMKRTYLFVAILSIIASVAFGNLYIAWMTHAGIIRPDYSPLFANDTETALFQLIFSPDNIPGEPTPGSGAPDGDDIVLDHRTVTAPGGIDLWAYGFAEIYGPAPFQAGFVYIRVFQAGTSIGNVPLGSLYLTGPLFATVNNPGPPTLPNFVDIGLGGPGEYGEMMLNQTVVPEPSVFALAALGAGVIGIRRIRRS